MVSIWDVDWYSHTDLAVAAATCWPSRALSSLWRFTSLPGASNAREMSKFSMLSGHEVMQAGTK
jgi:hypothetical protein